jgi:hypothetical protein
VEGIRQTRRQYVSSFSNQILIIFNDYDSPFLSWEPKESFEGGAEGMLANFWARVDAKGRDIEDGSQFQTGESVYPVGPPREWDLFVSSFFFVNHLFPNAR